MAETAPRFTGSSPKVQLDASLLEAVDVGNRVGFELGYRQAIADLRDEAARLKATEPRRYYSGMDLAADFLEHGNAPQGP